MSDIVIRAEGLGKRYLIGHQAENGRYMALRDVLMQNARGLWRKTRDLAQGKPIVQGDTLEEIWALHDVDFEIRRGEAVGIIGRNGAGKSTLLKVLSRITEPSAGRVTIKGRVASLLEVGTGFHPELTGRENIYLNGAILGMTRAEIKRKFDEIVDFAEVEKFLDTPVKRYSSGMYVRLAFAVAAHLEPEILVVDEVLAVGDAAFQKKCLGKMGDVTKGGRTVLFVSHNMESIEKLCGRVIWIHSGTVIVDSYSVGEAIQKYVEGVSGNCNSNWKNSGDQFQDPLFRPERLAIFQEGRLVSKPVSNDKDIQVVIEGYIEQRSENLFIGYSLYDQKQTLIFQSFHRDAHDSEWPVWEIGHVKLVSVIPRRLLNEGKHFVKLIALDRRMLGVKKYLVSPSQDTAVVSFEIQGGMSDSSCWDWKRPGVIAPIMPWFSDEKSDV